MKSHKEVAYEKIYNISGWILLFSGIASPIVIFPGSWYLRSNVLWIFCPLALVIYVSFLMQTHKRLRDTPDRMPLLAITFFSVALIFIFMFTGVVASNDLMVIDKQGTSEVDAFYYVAMTFTTVGYGDATPVGIPGRLFASFIALFGVTYAVVTLGVFLSGLGLKNKKPEEAVEK